MVDYSETFKSRKGYVVIEVDEYCAIVKNTNGDKIGNVDFLFIDDGYHQYLMLQNCFIEGDNRKWLHAGIGTRCVELIVQETGMSLVARSACGPVRSDGTHLTGDAPRWVSKMVSKGLIYQEGE